MSDLNKDGILAASEEAAKEPTKFNPHERAIYIRERVNEVRRLRTLGKNDIEIKEALGSFVTEYPTLFQYCAQSNFDYAQLEMMLGMLDKMDKGMTQHQASIAIGQKLVDKYVKPALR
jgi:hypothetical protein